MSYLDLKEITVNYGAYEVLHSINLSVERGEILTLFGPSGSGKSTILLTIAGFLTPRHGAVIFEGNDITNTPAHERGIGYLFQSPTLFPTKSVFSNVSFPLKMRGISKTSISKKVFEILELMDLLKHRDTMPHQLSGGEKQRVALARAMVFNPALILLDEPFSSLDTKIRANIQDELLRLRRLFNTTIVYVTHDTKEALSLSDRIAIVREGRIEQHAVPTDIYKHPASPLIAEMFGDTSITDGEVLNCSETTCYLKCFGQTICVERPEWLTKNIVRVRVLARPECWSIRSQVSETSFSCTMQRLIYEGPTSLAVCRLQDGSLIRARANSGTLFDEVHRNSLLTINLDTSALQLFPLST